MTYHKHDIPQAFEALMSVNRWNPNLKHGLYNMYVAFYLLSRPRSVSISPWPSGTSTGVHGEGQVGSGCRCNVPRKFKYVQAFPVLGLGDLGRLLITIMIA